CLLRKAPCLPMPTTHTSKACSIRRSASGQTASYSSFESLRTSRVQLFVPQSCAGLTVTGPIDSEQPRILRRPVPTDCTGRNLHHTASLRLNGDPAALHEQLPCNHEVVFAVWMLIGP